MITISENTKTLTLKYMTKKIRGRSGDIHNFEKLNEDAILWHSEAFKKPIWISGLEDMRRVNPSDFMEVYIGMPSDEFGVNGKVISHITKSSLRNGEVAFLLDLKGVELDTLS